MKKQRKFGTIFDRSSIKLDNMACQTCAVFNQNQDYKWTLATI